VGKEIIWNMVRVAAYLITTALVLDGFVIFYGEVWGKLVVKPTFYSPLSQFGLHQVECSRILTAYV